MKAQILKIAGVKSEKEFYKKYPSEEAFMKKHGKEFKKAQTGNNIATSNAGSFNIYNPYGDAMQSADMSGMTGADYTKYSDLGQAPNFSVNMPQGFPKQQSSFSMAAPNFNAYDPQGDQAGTGMAQGIFSGAHSVEDSPFGKKGGGIGGGMDPMKSIMGAFTGIVDAAKAHKENIKLSEKMETWAKVSDVQKRAGISNAFAEKPKNQWFSPDDPRFIHNANELSNTQGRGSDAITQNGGVFQGGGEIQNTFAPGTIYDDLGYEPFDESNDDVKAYQNGGMWSQFPDRSGNFAGGGDSSGGGGFGGNIGKGSPFDSMIGGGTTGGNLGGKIGSLLGPAGGMVGSMVGRYFDKNPGRQKHAQNTMNSNNAFLARLNTAGDITGGLQNMGVGQNGEALQPYEDGGWVSNDWTPQVIASFGGLDEQEVYDYAHEGMDTLRAGGHMRDYTPISNRGMETYAMGGQLKTHWGGEAEVISRNPYMPGSGEMVELNGASHDNDGIGISYGGQQGGAQQTAKYGADTDASIEAEGGETIMEMQDGGEVDPQTGKAKTSAVVLGNIAPSADIVKATGDQVLIDLFNKNPKKTFKRIGEVIAKDENKAASYMEIASAKANNADDTQWGALENKTADIIKKAGDAKFKLAAQQRIKSANLQSAVNDTKKDISYMKGKNISAEDLGKGKIKPDYDPITKDAELESPYAKHGAYLRKAQGGVTTDPADYDTNGIKNLQDTILSNTNSSLSAEEVKKRIPDWFGEEYGKEIGEKTLRNYRDYMLYNMLEQYPQSTYETIGYNNIGDDPASIKKFVNERFYKDGKFKLPTKIEAGVLGLTPEGYKYIGKDKQEAAAATSSAASAPASASAPATTTAEQKPSITEDQYNELVRLYEQGKKDKKSASIKEFQHKYHQLFPNEAIAAIQKTTKERGVNAKGKKMGLSKEEILSGKNTGRILESNEDEYFGPRTEQYMAKISSEFNKKPAAAIDELKLTPLGAKTTPTTAATTDKKEIDVVPLKQNKFGQYADMLRQFLPSAKLPGIDPRQFAGEYMAMAQNQYEPVPSQRMRMQLDPMTRVSYQDVRNLSTSDFRDALNQGAFNPAVAAGVFGKKALADQSAYAEEFRANQGLEQQIYGGNRGKINQEMAANLQLNADQMNKQSLALSKTKEINQKAIASIADKYMQHDARNLEYNVKSNMFPTYAYDASGRIRTQGPGFQANIPQVYGGKSNIKQVPVYDTDGKTILKYQMQEGSDEGETAVTKNGGSVGKKNRSSVVKNAKNGSIVKLHKNF